MALDKVGWPAKWFAPQTLEGEHAPADLGKPATVTLARYDYKGRYSHLFPCL